MTPAGIPCGVSDRVRRLKAKVLEAVPELFPHRALLVTESVREQAGRPPLLQRALALRHVLEHLPLAFEDEEFFVGNPTPRLRGLSPFPEFGARWIDGELDSFSTREADAVAVSPETEAVLRGCLEFWKDRSLDGVVERGIPATTRQGMGAGMITLGGTGTALGNLAVDYPKVLRLGLEGIREEIRARRDALEIRSPEDARKLEFWEAAEIACGAVEIFAGRYAALLRGKAQEAPSERRRELEGMASVLDRVPARPARTFREALQSLWLVYSVLHVESDPHAILLGRLDQYLYPYYEADRREGRITDDQVRDLLACLWVKCTSLVKLMDRSTSKAFAGFPLFQNVTLGGQTPEGRDACNRLTELALEAAAGIRMSQPSIGFRYHQGVSEAMMRRVGETIRVGLGYPAIMNDDAIIPKHLIRGATLAEARDYCTNCVETDIPGRTDSRAHSGYVNFPKCLLLALGDGVDPVTGERLGPSTGAFGDLRVFGDLMEAYRVQMAHWVGAIVRAYDRVDALHARVVPEPFLSCLLDDCIARGVPRQEGGARYNFSGIFGVGLSVVTDSLAALRRLVYEERSVSREELLEALRTDFRDREMLRQRLLQAPKYGNGDPEVDDLARECASLFCREVTSHRCIRGGIYLPELHSVATHVLFGEFTGATPDGRRAGETFADGISPLGGRDRSGPTAALRSVTSLDHVAVLQGLLYNQKFHPSALEGSAAIRKFAQYLRAYCSLGGHHIQFNIVSAETLREAKANPKAHRDLIVRVAGYSAYFAELNGRTQDEIIQRTELSW